MSRRKNGSLGPRPRTQRTPDGTQLVMNLNKYQNSFDKQAFNDLIKSQGVMVDHFRALPDPRGMFDRGDAHPVVSGIRRNSDGFIYNKTGTAQIFFSNNSDNWGLQIEGNIQHASAVATLPEFYEDKQEPFLIAPYDRFYIKDIETRVVNYQFIEASPTGTDELQFPATCVEELVDSDGIVYKENEHFQITKDGDIKWISSQRPSINPNSNRGKVYSIRYRYTPFFIVARILHEVRVSQVTNLADSSRQVERMPYQVMLIREYLFQDIANDPNQKIIDRRHQDLPPVGGKMGFSPAGTLGPKKP